MCMGRGGGRGKRSFTKITTTTTTITTTTTTTTTTNNNNPSHLTLKKTIKKIKIVIAPYRVARGVYCRNSYTYVVMCVHGQSVKSY